MSSVTRHLCPLDGCDWHYDEPDPSTDDLSGITPDTRAATFEDAKVSIVEQAMMRRLRTTESLIRAHFESHPLEQWVAALVRARQERDQLACALGESHGMPLS
ncbi:hypothetical protein VSR01_10820 [Actinacidiphila sp. DG2A-62]|uniref:hypothetical protein n=1 Tax=Actinacidiphila sp. DG2A-62 TaxID=3108821 RepID=UPI002DB899B8|nr:hypothetical protein [Actinacidiphila sp. DG2A-62]MEC3994011.1 hypothetical protein [Actinacidiphila sp. DG2A-62]